MEGEGIDLLFQALTERLAGQMVEHTLRLPPELVGRFRSKFFQMQSIIKEEYQDDGSLLIDIRMQQVDWSKLEKREETPLSYFLMTDESTPNSLSS